jgi:hypothetical protein
MAEICNKCFRPKHEISELHGHRLVTCVEMPKDQIVFMENYSCHCCKCPDIDIEQFHVADATNCSITDNVFSGTPICIDCGIPMPEFAIRCDECEATNTILSDEVIE